MFCKHCGKEIADNSKFCGYCGQIQSTATTEVNNNTVSEIKPANDHKKISCPYCKSAISADARICPFCRKKTKKKSPLLKIGIASAAILLVGITLIILFSVGIFDSFSTNKVKKAYSQMFYEMASGKIHMSDGYYDYNADNMVEYYYNLGNNENPNVFNNFDSITESDKVRLWNVAMSNYSYNVFSVEKQGQDYLVGVNISNKNTMDIMNTSISDYASQYVPEDVDYASTMFNAILDANDAYVSSEGGFLGSFGQILSTGSAAYNSTSSAVSSSNEYKQGMYDGTNAGTIVDIYEQYTNQGSYGTVTSRVIYFYATTDENGNWCIPDTIYVDNLDPSSEYDAYWTIYNIILGCG